MFKDEDIQTIQAPWELPCAQSLASEDCDEEFGTKVQMKLYILYKTVYMKY